MFTRVARAAVLAAAVTTLTLAIALATVARDEDIAQPGQPVPTVVRACDPTGAFMTAAGSVSAAPTVALGPYADAHDAAPAQNQPPALPHPVACTGAH